MKRRFALSSIIATALLPVTKLVARTFDRESKGFKTNAGEGRRHGHILLKGVNENIIDVKISGKDTNGDLAIFEQTSLSPKRGTPLHVHHSQDEIFYIVDGEYLFQVGDQRFQGKTGDCIFLPRKVPHAWTQMSERGKMTVTFQPAGKLEEFFLKLSEMTHVPDQKEIASIFEEHEMSVVGPPLKVE
jgi:quercetin dioxygenase-like cupin family protein